MCSVPTPYSTWPEGFWITPFSPRCTKAVYLEVEVRRHGVLGSSSRYFRVYLIWGMLLPLLCPKLQLLRMIGGKDVSPSPQHDEEVGHDEDHGPQGDVGG